METVGDAAALLASIESAAQAGDGEANYRKFEILFACLDEDARQPPKTESAGQPPQQPTLDCSTIDRSMLEIDHLAKLLERAAMAGSVDAQLAYFAVAGQAYSTVEAIARDTQGFEAFRRRAADFLHAASSTGNVDAMVALSTVYREGLLVPQDHVSAYAYLDAVNRTGVLPSSAQALQTQAARLTPEEIERARRLADQIYARCCG